LRILFLSPRQCWPAHSGAKLREYYLVRALSQDAVITHISFSETGAPVSLNDLPFCRQVVSVPRPRSYTPDKILRGLLGRRPLPVVNYTSVAMERTLARLLEEQQFELIHLDSIHMSAYVPLLRRATSAPMVYDWHNIESEAMRRYSSRSTSLLRRGYAALTGARLERLETEALGGMFGHLVCSERERGELLARKPEARIAVIENGVDCAFFAAPGAPFEERRRLVFVGLMDYHANAEAVLFFAREIWPQVRREFRGWSLTIVGANPTPEVRALHGSDDIEVTGTVPDVRPFYREARAAIVPLRVGGGTRLKILEAMAAGVPVVSTTLGAEGLAVLPDKEVLIADRAEDWIRHLKTLGDEPLWNEISAAGRNLARTRYDWEVIGARLRQTYHAWLA